MKAISDSLDEGQLNPVLEWSKAGLKMAEKNKVDSLKGIFLFDMGKAYTYKYNQYDTAIFYYKKVIPYFPDKMRKYNVFSVREIMERYADLGNKDSSFVYLNVLKALIDTMPDSSPKKITLSQNIATVYQYFGMFNTAIYYFQAAIRGNRQINNFRGLGLALANLAELYNEMDDNEKAIQYSKQALQYLADVNQPYMQTAGNIADFYIDQGNYDSALVYLKRSSDMAVKIGNTETEISNQVILARIFIAQKKYDAAQSLLDKSIAQLRLTDNQWVLSKALINYAVLDSSRQDYNAAKKHLTEALTISRKNSFLIFTILSLKNLAALLSRTGDYKNSLLYHNEYVKLKDSVAGEKTKAQLNDLEISYNTLQKEQEIALLKKDNDIKKLELKNSRKTFLFYIAGFIILLALTGIIFYNRSRRNKIKMGKLKAELQSQVLRSQMNPHFIFNCLNSIENFIMQNDKRQASDYLNKFSSLIRSILDSSRNEVVPLSKDMEALNLYVELEQLRFNHKFNYKSFIDPALAGGDYRVPALLIQPYIENAIVHGLAHSDENDLNLTVTASLEDDKIKYKIQDNGIGRNKSKQYNRHNKPNHESVGLKITEQRIFIFNGNKKYDPVSITDLFDEHKNPDGTKVEVTIKAI
ncbi:MAG: tetratricopeptide repeat protein [Bacteroidetes bacterium]|nr:tetratricopeptide repeat protein [Bacteroidota bacterium]MBS1930157.1 tetratricopeptide repeat protein [Bacteroidota bacterium]